jgi:PAS domain S-box-containing protein
MSASKDKKVSHDSLDNLRLFSAAVESAMDGIQIVDFDGKIMFSNKAVENIYGFTHDELLEKHVNDMNVDPDFAEREILPSIQKDGSWIGELMVKHKDGHHFPIWLNTSLVINHEGNPIAMVGIIKDMTDVKRAEKRIVALIDALPDIIYWKGRQTRNCFPRRWPSTAKSRTMKSYRAANSCDMKRNMISMENKCSRKQSKSPFMTKRALSQGWLA